LSPRSDGINHMAATVQQQSPPCRVSRCALVKALARGSIDQVTGILEANKDDAWMPLLDYKADPPICAAVDMRCDVAIINLLLAYGADVGMLNSRSMTALAVLASLPRRQEPTGCLHQPYPGESSHKDSIADKNRETETWMVNVGKRLLMAGCNPQEKTTKGQTAEELATASRWLGLATLIREWEEHKAHQLLKRSIPRMKHCSSGAFGALPPCIHHHIFEFICTGYWCDEICTKGPESQGP